MRIEVICTGDEVLTGKIVNTNFSYISQKLEDVGLSVQWETTVGDDRESLLLAFKLAGERADAVIVNGGLGPTVDDLSQEVAAQAAGVELALNEEWLGRMEDFFRRRSRVMPPNNRKQAMLPVDLRGDRQPDRHRVRLRAGHRQGALLLHPRGAARAAPHARGADHPAPAGQERDGDGHLSQAVPLLRPRRVARRLAAGRRGGAGGRRQREARLPRPLSAARDQADRARRRHGRHPAEARARRAGGAQAARQLHHVPRTT